jgi:hypothetical protein
VPADILSLSKFRKAKMRIDSEQKATENRILFGRSKAEKTVAKSEQALTEKRIDGHKLNTRNQPDE